MQPKRESANLHLVMGTPSVVLRSDYASIPRPDSMAMQSSPVKIPQLRQAASLRLGEP